MPTEIGEIIVVCLIAASLIGTSFCGPSQMFRVQMNHNFD